MRTFDEPLIRLERQNDHGETMTLVWDKDGKQWFHHDDDLFNLKDFIPYEDIRHTDEPRAYKFVFNQPELTALACFDIMVMGAPEKFFTQLDPQGKC